MKIVKLNQRNFNNTLKLAKKALENDGLIVAPFDTTYGLCANSLSSAAVKKIYEFKGKSFGKAISITLKNLKEIEKYTFVSKEQKAILKTLLPGPFTVILKSKHKTAPEIEAEDKTIGIRIINYPFINKLLDNLDYPITSTSAGKGPHYSVSSFLKTLSQKKKAMISLIINAGKLPKRPTSTVIRLVKDELKVLREGVLNPKLIERFISKSENNTKIISQKIYKKYLKKHLKNNSAFVILQGNLGCGKTVFAKGIGKLFKKELVSPTFVLMDEYKIGKPPIKTIYHLDLYRIETEEELKDLKLKKFFHKGNLFLAEWGEKLSVLEQLKKENVVFFWVRIKETGENERKIIIYEL